MIRTIERKTLREREWKSEELRARFAAIAGRRRAPPWLWAALAAYWAACLTVILWGLTR